VSEHPTKLAPAGPTRPGPSAADRMALPLSVLVDHLRATMERARAKWAHALDASTDPDTLNAIEAQQCALDALSVVVLELCRGKII